MKNRLVFIISIAFLLVTTMISAFGVSSPYWEGNPLTISKGETTEVRLNLQNMVGEEDLSVKAEITEGRDIASMNERIYDVKAHTDDTYTYVTINVPAEANFSTKRVTVDFKTVANGEGDAVTLGTGMTITFEVRIGEEVKEASPLRAIIIISAIILLLIILAIILLRKRKEKK